MIGGILKILGFCCLLQGTVWANNTEDLGKQFLAENQKKTGVHTLPSGLQYKIIQNGEGTPPERNDFVTVHYRGTLIDGTEFDSSYARKTPVSFAVSGVIPGWTEALQLMSPGAKWILYIPPQLAYGKQKVGPHIVPHSTLIFEVELLSVKPGIVENPIDFNQDAADGS
jgi:FKBP-type peptidyl-prolyl cis-trans isomerase FklB